VSGNVTIRLAQRNPKSSIIEPEIKAVSGVKISFRRLSKPRQPILRLIPGTVTTNGRGDWSASGFAEGVLYQATPSKPGCTFLPAFIRFKKPGVGLNFLARGAC
jgi:hypothetical protein